MYVKKLIDYVQKNYKYFSEGEMKALFDFDVKKFFLLFFTKVNSNKNNKALVKVGVKIYFFKEKYKQIPCEFFWENCKTENELVKWYHFLVKLLNFWKIDELFEFWKNKFGETSVYNKYFHDFLVLKPKLQKKYDKFEEDRKYIFSVQHLERLIFENNLSSAKLFLKKLIAEYPYKYKLYDYFTKINDLQIKELKESISEREFEDKMGGIDIGLSQEKKTSNVNEKYDNLSEKELIKTLNYLLKEKEISEGIRLANRIIKNKKVKDIKKIKKIKKKLINYEIERIKTKQEDLFQNELKILEKLIKDKRVDRLLGVLQGIFEKYEFVNKKPLRKYIPRIYKLEKEVSDIDLLKDVGKFEKILFKYSKLSMYDLYLFYDKMAWFAKSQVDLKTSLNFLQYQVKSVSLKKLLFYLLNGVDSGLKVTDILMKFKEIPHRDISMLKVAEQVGGFDQAFYNLKQIYEDSIFRRKKLKSMMIYPVVAISISIIIMILMLTQVFPKFVLIYDQFGVELPLPTKIMLVISDFLTHHWLISIEILFLVIILIIVFLRTKTGNIFKSWFLLNFPIIKDIYKKSQILYFLENFTMMLKGGLSISDILDYLILSINNYFFQRELVLTKMLVLTGDPISKAMGISDSMVNFKSVILPVEVAYGIKTGEDTGKLPEVMENLLKNYKKEFHLYMENLQQIIEPLLILVIGGMIFMLVLAIFLPMMGIYQQISKQVKF